jgi:hypothetical protein
MLYFIWNTFINFQIKGNNYFEVTKYMRKNKVLYIGCLIKIIIKLFHLIFILYTKLY